MEISLQSTENSLTVCPKGRLDSASSGELETTVNAKLSEAVNELIIDLADVDFISSKGLRILVTLYYKMQGKKMVIKNPNSSVSEVFKLSGLLKIFDIQ